MCFIGKEREKKEALSAQSYPSPHDPSNKTAPDTPLLSCIMLTTKGKVAGIVSPRNRISI
jgi:hypothetical protein